MHTYGLLMSRAYRHDLLTTRHELHSHRTTKQHMSLDQLHVYTIFEIQQPNNKDPFLYTQVLTWYFRISCKILHLIIIHLTEFLLLIYCYLTPVSDVYFIFIHYVYLISFSFLAGQLTIFQMVYNNFYFLSKTFWSLFEVLRLSWDYYAFIFLTLSVKLFKRILFIENIWIIFSIISLGINSIRIFLKFQTLETT